MLEKAVPSMTPEFAPVICNSFISELPRILFVGGTPPPGPPPPGPPPLGGVIIICPIPPIFPRSISVPDGTCRMKQETMINYIPMN